MKTAYNTMVLSSKDSRPSKITEDIAGVDFDFGDPEIVSVEIAPGKFLDLEEPSASDLIEIEKIGARKELSEMEQILATVCILHHPGENGIKLNMKQAKRLRAKQIHMLGEAVAGLMGIKGGDEEDPKSDSEEEL